MLSTFNREVPGSRPGRGTLHTSLAQRIEPEIPNLCGPGFDSRAGYVTTDIMTRFWSKTKQGENGCLEWTAAKTDKGYGRFKVSGKLVLPHRFIMEWINQTKYDKSIDVRHRCDNPPCVNPAHLQPGTRSANMTDCVERGRYVYNNPYGDVTHCPDGHPYSGDNLYVGTNGGRNCRKCRARQQRERRASRKLNKVP